MKWEEIQNMSTNICMKVEKMLEVKYAKDFRKVDSMFLLFCPICQHTFSTYENKERAIEYHAQHHSFQSRWAIKKALKLAFKNI